jgi:hypothetical protein
MDSHHRKDASTQRTGKKVSRGKAFAVSIMIRRRISIDDGSRWKVLGSAVEAASVEALDKCHKTPNQWIEIGSASP